MTHFKLSYFQIKERDNALTVHELQHSIKFDGVSFDYNAADPSFMGLPKRAGAQYGLLLHYRTFHCDAIVDWSS